MPDERWRSQQRRARQNDPEAMAKALHAMVRAGIIQDSVVTVAASLAHAPAMHLRPGVRPAENPLTIFARSKDAAMLSELLLQISEALVARLKVEWSSRTEKNLLDYAGFDNRDIKLAVEFLDSPNQRTLEALLMSRFTIAGTVQGVRLSRYVGRSQVDENTGRTSHSQSYGHNLFVGCVDAWRLLNQTEVAIDWRAMNDFLRRVFAAYATFERVCSGSTAATARQRCRDYLRASALAALLPDAR